MQSRLAENTFARDGLVDLSGPVIQLQNLSPEDMYVLLDNIRGVFASCANGNESVPKECLTAFMQHCSKRIGDAYFRTPRNTVKAFVNLLSVIEQNPGADWQQLVGGVEIDGDRADGPDQGLSIDDSADDELATFRL